MSEDTLVAIIGLVLGLLPIAIVALALVGVVALIVLIFGFVWLLEQPVTCWVCAATAIFNVIVLVPLWAVAVVAMDFEPALWDQASRPVWIFSVCFVLPAVILFYYCWKHRRAGEP